MAVAALLAAVRDYDQAAASTILARATLPNDPTSIILRKQRLARLLPNNAVVKAHQQDVPPVQHHWQLQHQRRPSFGDLNPDGEDHQDIVLLVQVRHHHHRVRPAALLLLVISVENRHPMPSSRMIQFCDKVGLETPHLPEAAIEGATVGRIPTHPLQPIVISSIILDKATQQQKSIDSSPEPRNINGPNQKKPPRKTSSRNGYSSNAPVPKAGNHQVLSY